jgi:hypothetical protein
MEAWLISILVGRRAPVFVVRVKVWSGGIPVAAAAPCTIRSLCLQRQKACGSDMFLEGITESGSGATDIVAEDFLWRWRSSLTATSSSSSPG